MKRNFLKTGLALLGLGLLFLASHPVHAQEAPSGMKLFLLIGQSNMAGRGRVGAADKVTNPRIWMLTKGLKWVLAKDPLHFDKGSAGVGLASEFARTLVKNDPNINIGLIPCAVGNTSLDQWQPAGELYNQALSRTKEAIKQGTLAGILRHQGEADRAPAKVATYPTRFSTMISKLRQELNAPAVPVVIGELGRFRPDQDTFNAMLPEIVRQVPNCALATAEELSDNGDQLHFNTPSLHLFGQRYAAVYLKLQTK